MTPLGDLLELVHLARGRFSTVRFEATERRDVARALEAYDRRVCAAGAPSHLDLDAARTAPPIAAGVRAWFAQPHRVREERREGNRVGLSVADGERWWKTLPDWATLAQQGDGWAMRAAGETARFLLDPAPLTGCLDLEVAGDAEVAGRRALTVTATPRPGADLGPLDPFDASGDGYRFAVDAERGVLLAAAAELDGRPYAELDVQEIAFDEPLDDSLFRYEPAAGEPVLAPGELAGELVPLEDAAARASFTVLALPSVEAGWEMDVRYTPPRERPPAREAVDVTLRRRDASHSVSLHQSAPPFERWQLNGTEAALHDGRGLLVSRGGWNRVLLEERGTCVEVGSATVETDALVELALALVPAPRERPPLVA